MKDVLSISLSENIFSKRSTDVLERQMEYSKHLKSLTIIVFTKKNYKSFKKGNLEIIPTNSKNALFGFLDINRTINLLKKNGRKFEVVTTQDPFFLGLIGLRASKLFNAKFKPQLHTDIYSNSFWKKENILNYLQFKISNYVINKSDSIRVVNKKNQKILIKKGIKASFIPVATDLNKFNKIKTNKDIDILYVGRLVKVKNLFFLIDLIKEVKKTSKNLNCFLIGDGPLKTKIIKYVKENNLEKNVTLVKSKEHNKLNEFYNRSKILILPSLYEGWGLVAIEASLCECPVIMSNTGCAGEIIKKNETGIVCEINNKEEFMLGIKYFLENPEKSKLMAKKARELCLETLNTNELRKRWCDFLNE